LNGLIRSVKLLVSRYDGVVLRNTAPNRMSVNRGASLATTVTKDALCAWALLAMAPLPTVFQPGVTVTYCPPESTYSEQAAPAVIAAPPLWKVILIESVSHGSKSPLLLLAPPPPAGSSTVAVW